MKYTNVRATGMNQLKPRNRNINNIQEKNTDVDRFYVLRNV